MARLDWKRFRDEEPKVGSRIIRARTIGTAKTFMG